MMSTWLNTEFINGVFTKEEQELLKPYTIKTEEKELNYYSGMPIYEMVEYELTDKVFLLDKEEANNLFASNKERATVPTEYALTKMIPFYYAHRNVEDGNGNIEIVDLCELIHSGIDYDYYSIKRSIKVSILYVVVALNRENFFRRWLSSGKLVALKRDNIHITNFAKIGSKVCHIV